MNNISLRQTKQKKKHVTEVAKCVTTLPIFHWFNFKQSSLVISLAPNSRRKRCALTFNLFVRQCENGVMKSNIVAGYKQIKFSEVRYLFTREITIVRDETEIHCGRFCRRDLHARTGTKKKRCQNMTKETTSQF